MSELNIIPLRHNLLVDHKYSEVKQKILSRINELGLANQKYKYDIEMLKLIANLVEHLVNKKDKVNKKELVIILFRELFVTTQEEELAISNNIEFLHANNAIKKISFYKLFKTGIREWIGKRFR